MENFMSKEQASFSLTGKMSITAGVCRFQVSQYIEREFPAQITVIRFLECMSERTLYVFSNNDLIASEQMHIYFLEIVFLEQHCKKVKKEGKNKQRICVALKNAQFLLLLIFRST